ncbi:hypothetical protein BC332_14001 [Capsicum chinense]|nr:hypothetical protein BC332_14001 [Capsicum chinense]
MDQDTSHPGSTVWLESQPSRSVHLTSHSSPIGRNSSQPSRSVHSTSYPDFMRILSSFKNSLKKILFRGEFDEYPKEREMHCTTRLVEMLHQFSDELHVKNLDGKEDFLMEEIKALEPSNAASGPISPVDARRSLDNDPNDIL